VPASNAGHLLAALHPHTWLGDTGVGCVHRLREHVVLDRGLPGANAPRAAGQTRLGPPDITLFLDAYFRSRLVVLVVLVSLPPTPALLLIASKFHRVSQSLVSAQMS